MNCRILIAALLHSTVSLLAHAHEGMIHVMGTVTTLTDKSVTVQTSDKKTVKVVLIATTTYEKGTQPSSWKTLKVGDQVVIHAMKVKDALQPHSLRFTESTASAH